MPASPHCTPKEWVMATGYTSQLHSDIFDCRKRYCLKEMDWVLVDLGIRTQNSVFSSLSPLKTWVFSSQNQWLLSKWDCHSWQRCLWNLFTALQILQTHFPQPYGCQEDLTSSLSGAFISTGKWKACHELSQQIQPPQTFYTIREDTSCFLKN